MREKGVVIAVSLVLGLAAAGLFYTWSRGLPPFPKKTQAAASAGDMVKKEETRMVVVAANDIPRRATIKPEMLKAVEMPKSLAHPQAVSKIDDVVGKVLQDDLIQGEILLTPHIAGKKAPSELTFAIPAGFRAATIATSVPTGVANMIRPGDYVDVLLYVDGRKVGGPDVGTTILRKTLVLAIDKKLETWPGDKMQQMSAKMDNDGPEYQSVTLALSPKDANMLVLAESIGFLKLTLHGADGLEYPDLDKEFQPVFVTDLLEVNGYDASRLAKITPADDIKDERDGAAAKKNSAPSGGYVAASMPDMGPLPVVPSAYLNAAPGAMPLDPNRKVIYVMRGSELSTSLDGSANTPLPPQAAAPISTSERQLALKGVGQ
jgi:pilus assembly protein CpaB